MRRRLLNKGKNFVWTGLKTGAGRIVCPPLADFKASRYSHRQRERYFENSDRNALCREGLPKRCEVAAVITGQAHRFRSPAPLAVDAMRDWFFARHERWPHRAAADVRWR